MTAIELPEFEAVARASEGAGAVFWAGEEAVAGKSRQIRHTDRASARDPAVEATAGDRRPPVVSAQQTIGPGEAGFHLLTGQPAKP